MKRRIILAMLTVTVGLLSGCGASTSTDTTTDTTQTGTTEETSDTTSASGDAIRVINGKIEIDASLKALAKTYQEETGQEVVIESLGGGTDIQATLKGDYQAGNMPDIFVIGGPGDYVTWEGMVADLGDCEFASITDIALTDDSGMVVGFPYTVEGYGLTYNADLLAQAGIDPATLINYAAYEEAFATLEGMKEELGITAVCSVAAEAGQMYWSTGSHLFGYYLSGGLDRADKTYIDLLLNAELDQDRLGQFGKFYGMVCEYSDPQVLISGSYDDQLSLWAQGKTAFITQGNWIDVSLDSYNVTFEVGLAPFAFTEEDMPGILADAPSWWVVYGESSNVEGCKAFLDWLATSQAGQKGLIEECGMVSPFETATTTPPYPLSTMLSEYIASGNTYAWDWTSMPDGMAMQYTGYVFEAFAKGDIDVEGFKSMMAAQVVAGSTN
ncbi:MAG: ABC transporter substrate-binding protein [Eubacteriales bacterium]